MSLAKMPRISGSTDIYLILGDPVEQVKAPESFNLIFARLGIDAVLVPARVAPADLHDFVRTVFKSPSVKGLWVTIPHKVQITALLDRCSDLGRRAGAVNAVRRDADGGLTGALFDGEGFAASLDYFHIAWTGKKVLVIGAGGAAAAIGASLAHGPRAAAELAFFDPTPGRAAQLAARLQPGSLAAVHAVADNDPQGYDLVVNASPLGLESGDALPCDVARMSPHAALVDILMKNQPTPAVRAARARGLVAQPGFEMMIQQTHLYLDFFGLHDAAQHVRDDCGFIRDLICPAEALREIPRPRSTGPGDACPT
ncbi:MAG TPA: shikimate dehydrogenase [Ramlibacter sp.]|nr:shikimate dehydrogenase [Ramlibacter sp.]